MSVLDLPVFAALKHKMEWHQTRQTLLAENVANAGTPGYQARDLEPFDFGSHLEPLQMSGLAAGGTRPGHVPVGGETRDGFGARALSAFQSTPNGNSVTLEDEMMKVTANQLDYQAATTLYGRSLKLIRTALGRA